MMEQANLHVQALSQAYQQLQQRVLDQAQYTS
jgi:hypothetical protein